MSPETLSHVTGRFTTTWGTPRTGAESSEVALERTIKPADCPEGYDVFTDTKYYYTLVTTGKSSTVKAELKQQMMTEHPGEREYNVLDSSFSYPTASHAVAIRYTSNVSPWNCRPKVVAIGLGKTYDEALARALEIKADNFSKNAPYEELKHITWQGK